MGGIDGVSCQHHQVMMAITLGLAGGQKANDEARQRDAPHDVFVQHGHQDGVRCCETEAHRTNYGGS